MVKSLFRLPHSLLLLPVVIFIIFFLSGQPYDIQLHDTIFVVHLFNNSFAGHLPINFILLCFPFWLIYLVMQKVMLSKHLSWFHVTVTTIAAIYILWLVISITLLAPHFQLEKVYEKYYYFPIRVLFAALPLLFLLAQLAFLVNLIGGLIKRMP